MISFRRPPPSRMARTGPAGTRRSLGRPNGPDLVRQKLISLRQDGTDADAASGGGLAGRIETGSGGTTVTGSGHLYRADSRSRRDVAQQVQTIDGGRAAILVGQSYFLPMRQVVVTPAGAIGVTLPLAGEHNVLNALAASAIAVALDVPLPTIKAGLEGAEHVKGRLLRHDLSAGWSVIDDSYNANPGSAAAAIATLALENGEAWLVLGDMKELGPEAARLHTDIGALAKARGIARLYSVGPLAQAASAAFGAGARHFSDQSALIEALRAELHAGVCCLVKGSRSSAMERVVAALLGKNGGGDAHAA